MNLQQLNYQGQHVGAFIITCVVALLLTMFVWFAVELHRVELHLPGMKRKDETSQGPRAQRKRRHPGLMTRIGLLKFLWWRGHREWMWTTNAWLCILTNDRWGRIYFEDHDDYLAVPEVRTFNETTVCEYVAAHAEKGGVDNWFDPRIFFAQKKSSSEDRASYPGVIEHELVGRAKRKSIVEQRGQAW